MNAYVDTVKCFREMWVYRQLTSVLLGHMNFENFICFSHISMRVLICVHSVQTQKLPGGVGLQETDSHVNA